LVELVHLLEEPSRGGENALGILVAAHEAVDIDEFHAGVKLAGNGNPRHVDGAADEFFINQGVVPQLVCGIDFDLDTAAGLLRHFLGDVFHELCRRVIRRGLAGELESHLRCGKGGRSQEDPQNRHTDRQREKTLFEHGHR